MASAFVSARVNSRCTFKSSVVKSNAYVVRALVFGTAGTPGKLGSSAIGKTDTAFAHVWVASTAACWYCLRAEMNCSPDLVTISGISVVVV